MTTERNTVSAKKPKSVVHRTPSVGSGRTQCCDLPPFELPRTDRMTTVPGRVTCTGRDEMVERTERR